MAKKNNSPRRVYLLFLIAVILLAGGWVMKLFPLLIFAAYAPLFAISDQAKNKEMPWNHLELILLALVLSLLCSVVFDFSQIIIILIQAILLTLAFAGYAFSYQSLGNRLGKFTIIFFWLGIEYLLLKLPWRDQFVFLADSLLLQPAWWRWNENTGYLAITCWVLTTNLILYLAIFNAQKINWYLIILTIIFIALPIGWSYFNKIPSGIGREQMMQLYSNTTQEKTGYQATGELIARTAAWISVLILLLSFVKNKINKK